MKKFIIVLLLSTIGYSQIPEDKKLHFVVGAVMSAATYDFVYKKTKDRKKAIIWGLTGSIVAATAKELLDQHIYRGFDSNDLLATTAGAISATLTIEILKGRKKKKYDTKRN